MASTRHPYEDGTTALEPDGELVNSKPDALVLISNAPQADTAATVFAHALLIRCKPFTTEDTNKGGN